MVQALAFVPVTVYVRVVGAQQETEPRQNVRIKCNNRTHTVGLGTSNTKHIAGAKAGLHIFKYIHISGTPARHVWHENPLISYFKLWPLRHWDGGASPIP